MLHLALAALLAGAPLTSADPEPPTGDKDKAPRTEASVGIFKPAVAQEEAIVNDTYSFGRAEATFIKLWVGYAWGRVDEYYDAAGNVGAIAPGVTQNTVQHAFLGGQVDFINLPFARVGVGGQLMTGSQTLATAGGDFASGFGLQNLKLFAHARGRAAGIHGGYILDLADEPTATEPVTGTDNRDAIFVGADFDYPSQRFRLFGGIDYFMIQDNANIGAAGTAPADLAVFNMGAGVRFGFVELGAAALLRAAVHTPGGGHQGSIAPYLRLSPPQIPVSIAVRGAVPDEFADYGFSLGGARKPVTQMGFTVAATVGF